MRQFTICAAVATVFAALLASAPARAESLGGASAKNGNQCFTYSVGQQRDGRFGYWGACPQTASTVAAPARRHRSSR